MKRGASLADSTGQNIHTAMLVGTWKLSTKQQQRRVQVQMHLNSESFLRLGLNCCCYCCHRPPLHIQRVIIARQTRRGFLSSATYYSSGENERTAVAMHAQSRTDVMLEEPQTTSVK